VTVFLDRAQPGNHILSGREASYYLKRGAGMEAINAIMGSIDGFISRHQSEILTVALSLVLFKHFIRPRSSSVPELLFFSLVPMIALAGFFIIAFGSEPEPVTLSQFVALLLCYGVVLYVLLCDALMLGFADYLTRKRGEKWIKELDYLYLTMGALGVLGSVNRLELLSGRFSKADIFAPAVLTTAVVIRFIKTRAEINGWNRPKS
jgi:hypothetical protein